MEESGGRRTSAGVLAHYDTLEGTRRAIESLRADGFPDLRIYSPIPAPELEEAMEIHDSPVGRWALLGGITGIGAALVLTIGTSLGYPLVTGGKAVASLQPFVVVMFELMVLFTGIFSVMGMLIHAGRPKLTTPASYRAVFSVDRWGIWVPSAGRERSRVEEAVRRTEPLEMEVEE